MRRTGKPAGRADTSLSAPHQEIVPRDERDRLLVSLLDALWVRYRERVGHVRAYEQVVHAAGGRFINDHIAFRTIACQAPTTGIATLSRLFVALGYEAAGCYTFPDKHLAATHFQHPVVGFPKIFVSELELWRLEPDVARRIHKSLKGHRPAATDRLLHDLSRANQRTKAERASLLDKLLAQFHRLPWDAPGKGDVLAVNEASQYAAWVLVHGYHVNHFTALINSHGVAPLDNIDKTVAALVAAGVPMKSEIEGQLGSKLRQTATEAAVVDVAIVDRGKRVRMPWTYAYFELAERGQVVDPASGKPVRFEAFLGAQATQLFEMTRVK